MEAFLQARSRDAGMGCARGWSVGIDRVAADLASRLLDRRHCDDRAVAVDVARHQADQRCVAGDRTREGRAADARPCCQMGRTPCRAYRIGRPRHSRVFVGMSVALGAARDSRALASGPENGTLPMTIDLPNKPAPGRRYAYKASLIG